MTLFYTILSYHLQPTVLEASRENLSRSLAIFFSVVGTVNKCIYIYMYLLCWMLVWAAIFYNTVYTNNRLTFFLMKMLKVSHVFSHILVKSKSNLRSFSVFFTLIIVLRLCMYFIYQYFRKVSLNCVFSFIFFR